MDPLAVIFLVVALLACGVAIASWRRAQAAEQLVEELQGKLRARREPDQLPPAGVAAAARAEPGPQPVKAAEPAAEEPAERPEGERAPKKVAAEEPEAEPAAKEPEAEPVPSPAAAAPQAAPAPAPAAVSETEDVLRRHAAKMVRGAVDIAKNLGFDFLADPQVPNVYKITLSLRSDWDTRAMEYVQANPFVCVRGVAISRDEVVVTVDTAAQLPD